jgi:alkylated DNA repair dioxygenase AlkB
MALRPKHHPMPPHIEGLLYQPMYITPGEEKRLLQHIDAEKWDTQLRRRVQHYGWKYNYAQSSVTSKDRLGPLPPWLAALAQQLRDDEIVESTTVFDQVIVNEYHPGQGIAPHVDNPRIFGSEIVMLSLGSAVDMNYTPVSGKKDAGRTVHLARRSVARIRGDARYKWKHGIAARKTDLSPDGTVRRARRRRVSITFRTVKVCN